MVGISGVRAVTTTARAGCDPFGVGVDIGGENSVFTLVYMGCVPPHHLFEVFIARIFTLVYGMCAVKFLFHLNPRPARDRFFHFFGIMHDRFRIYLEFQYAVFLNWPASWVSTGVHGCTPAKNPSHPLDPIF